MKISKLFLFLFVVVNFVSCNNKYIKGSEQGKIDYGDTAYWYSCGDTMGTEADVFYVYPTVTMKTFSENGSSWFANIAKPEMRVLANDNQRFNKLLYEGFGFYAPYYRQIIFDAYNQHDTVVRTLLKASYVDVKDAFDYYLEHFNNNRPYFLLGHSQGSQVLVELLKNGIEDADRQRLVGAYCIGCSVTSDELAEHPNLQPATDSVNGTLVVLNSVTRPDAVSPLFADNAVGINPLTWATNTSYASSARHLGMARYNTRKDSVILLPHTVSGRLVNHLMVCDSLDPNMVYEDAFADKFPYGNLHFADSWLYGGNIKANMRLRVENYFR